MILKDLKQAVEDLPKETKVVLRSEYINKFIDTSSNHFKKHIKVVDEYSDGICYSGYLWECLLNPVIIGFEDVIACKNKLNKVFVFWDIHSSEKIWIEDYWKFGKDSMLKLNYENLLDNLEYFPEDVYIFDESLNWTIVLTHEDNDEIRICARVGDI